MSRPQKIIPPVKGKFTDIINAIADGRGMGKTKRREDDGVIKASEPKKAKKK